MSARLWLCLLQFLGFLALTGRSQSVYCRVVLLSELEGEISGVGQPLGESSRDSECAWHIFPSLSLQAIDFTLLEEGQFSGYDALVIYGSGHMHSSTRVATFHRTRPLPLGMTLTGTSEALLVFSAVSNETRFRLHYTCRPYGMKLGDTWFSPVGYACVLAAFIVLGFAISLMPVYMVCYCKARRHQDFVMQESQLMVRSELARRFRENENVRVEEQQVVASLQALPVEMWKDREAEVGKRPSCDECCLCLEAYTEEDMLRVLPCRHYFHEACIDKWFSARRFLPRSCPLCKADPTVPSPPGADEQADSARPSVSGTAPAAVVGRPQQAWEE